MRRWELARIALENAWQASFRTWLTVAGVAIACGALISMVGFVLGLREQVERPINQLGLLSNIEVKPITNPNEQQTSPPLDRAMLKRLEQIPGVELAYPDYRLSQIKLTYQDRTKPSYAMGVVREVALIGLADELLLAGSFFSLGRDPEVVLGAKLVSALGFESADAAIGQTVTMSAGGLVAQPAQEAVGDEDATGDTLETNTAKANSPTSTRFTYADRKLDLKVVGVITAPQFTSLSDDAILLPVDIMGDLPASWMEHGLQQLTRTGGRGHSGFATVNVRARSAREVPAVEAAIQELGFATHSVVSRLKEIRRFFVFMEVLLSAVGTVALIVAGLGILNTMTMAVLERFQEIGIYKAVGAADQDIRWMFLVEAGAVGLLGGIGGLILARIVSWILAWAFDWYAASQNVDGPDAVFVFPAWLLCGGVLYAVLISILSGLYPANRAARVDPIHALRRG